ncbi:MAG: HEAT repeat protein/tRNA A-37 threonylcarbamoyl transferase component Bud32 [Planctomycetota bacterium]|jgi:HEAT repeat protein/tRNA A-37 threonylcarbamoyl transferase component Bud32
MARLNTILFKRSLKQFLDNSDLISPKGLSLLEKINESAADNLNLILEALIGADEPHFSALKEIYRDNSKDFSEEFFLEKLADEETIIRVTTAELLSEGANIDADKLFAQLHRPGASAADIIEVLGFQKQQLKPEDVINNAVKMNSSFALNLLALVGDSTVDIDLSMLRFQPEKLTDPEFKVNLLRFLCTVEQPEVSPIIVRFLADTNKTVVLEALYSLVKIPTRFDPAIILPYIPTMSEKEQELALETLVKQADTSLVPKLVAFTSEKSPSLQASIISIIAKHADKEGLAKFLTLLDKEDDWTKTQVLKGFQQSGSRHLLKVAKELTDHDNPFVKDSVQTLVLKTMNSADIKKIGLLATNEDSQVRERAIKILAKSSNREALEVLKKVITDWPDSALSVLIAIKQLGFSKGLETCFKGLSNPDESIQRAALSTISALTTDTHAEMVFDTIKLQSGNLGPSAKKAAQAVLQKMASEFGLNREINGAKAPKVTAAVSSPPAKAAVNLDGLKAGSLWMDRYHIIEEIGRGAMGRVMLVEDDVIEEKLVLKFMNPEITIESGALERFKREVKYTRKVGHPNIIRVHDFLLRDGLSAISMEYFESEGLDVILREAGMLDVLDGLEILLQVASGMSASHEQVVIHRDLKPGNILLDKTGQVKIVDFGIASAASGAESALTQTGSIIGSPAFMSPERADGQTADYRSDIYALGVITYYMMCGQLPYSGKPMEVLQQHCAGNARPLAEINPEIHPLIEKLTHKMMALNPDQRPPSMNAIRDELTSIIALLRI